MCKYCGYEHGIIGDVVCPVKKNFPDFYATKHIPLLEVKWPVERINFISVLSDTKKKEFQEYMENEARLGGAGYRKYRD